MVCNSRNGIHPYIFDDDQRIVLVDHGSVGVCIYPYPNGENMSVLICGRTGTMRSVWAIPA